MATRTDRLGAPTTPTQREGGRCLCGREQEVPRGKGDRMAAQMCWDERPGQSLKEQWNSIERAIQFPRDRALAAGFRVAVWGVEIQNQGQSQNLLKSAICSPERLQMAGRTPGHKFVGRYSVVQHQKNRVQMLRTELF